MRVRVNLTDAPHLVNINVLISTHLDIQTGPEQEIELYVDFVHGDNYDFDPGN